MKITGAIRHGGRMFRKGDEPEFRKVMGEIDPDRLKYLESSGALRMGAVPATADEDDDENEDEETPVETTNVAPAGTQTAGKGKPAGRKRK